MLYVVRHGRTAHNAAHRLLGRTDLSLDDEGRRQAAAAADALAAVVASDARIVCSPLKRTRETAAVVAGALGAGVAVDDRWIELDYGELEGVPVADVPAEVWEAWRADPAFRPPGGESLADVEARVVAACGDLADEAASRDVIVVTHVSPIKAAVCWALAAGPATTWRTFVAPASVTRIAVGPRGPSLHGFNDVAHLR